MKKYILLTLLLSGCGQWTGETELSGALDHLEQLLNTSDWTQIQQQTATIDALYEKTKWKMQLLGDEDEYESMQEAVAHLQTAAQSEEQVDCLEELTTIRTYIRQIYDL